FPVTEGKTKLENQLRFAAACFYLLALPAAAPGCISSPCLPQRSAQPSTSADPVVSGATPPAGNHDDQGDAPSEGNVCEQRQEEDVSGLINSDGEEERWESECPDPKSRSDPPTAGGSAGKAQTCCPVCGRDCFKASALKKHLRIHSGERPFQCPTCSKSFVQYVHMTEHQRIHTGEKPFTCAVCSKSFTFSSALRRHRRVHTNERPFHCAVCPKTFKQVCDLKDHQLIHTGVRYQCPLCSKSFSRALELTYHVDVHSDAKPYFCSICQKNLSGARTFRRHMKKHEADKSKMDASAVGAEPEATVTAQEA
uniref:C2H2-type domain-containing protein n=1 Tax=Fundulus heteroclitus TaxID=8078 RepID=A0A3Q2NWA9_FUNHE